MSENRSIFEDYPTSPPDEEPQHIPSPPTQTTSTRDPESLSPPHPRSEIRHPSLPPTEAEILPHPDDQFWNHVWAGLVDENRYSDITTAPPYRPPLFISEVSTSSWDIEPIREAHSILTENRMSGDAHGLSELLGEIVVLEDHIASCETAIEAMRSQLATVRELRNSALRNTLGNAIQDKERDIAETKGLIASIKGSIANGCRNFVTAVKERGITTIDSITQFLQIKESFIKIEANAQSSIDVNERLVNKVETFSEQFHSARSAIRNMGRALIGKAPLDRAPEVGKLANFIASPYRKEIVYQTAIRDSARATIQKYEAREDRANAIRENRNEKRAAKHDKKRGPSQQEKLKGAKKEAVTHNEQNASEPRRTRTRGGEAK